MGCAASLAPPATGDVSQPQPQQESPQPQGSAADAPPKPAIRRIWDHLFGSDEQGQGEDRKAG
jgi:hypothetical protein